MKPGDSLDGRYTIVERLGAGGMGEVYKATHDFLGTPRVIKVVHPQISGSEDAQDRFLKEARAATKVQHPNVATLHDFASLPTGAHYMVWEFIDGENLAQRLRARRTLPPAQAIRIAVQALQGLEAIHRAGIIHRDISPENLMITEDDQVKIIDLGVAKVEDTTAVSQTRTGIFVGKLRYASPEQLGFLPEGERIDGRADIYAMAMVIVELLTGRPPYEAKSPHEYFMLHAREPKAKTVELPVEMAGSAALSAILEKALARDRTQRWISPREFADALEEAGRALPETSSDATMVVPLAAAAARAAEAASAQASTLQDTVIRNTARNTPPAEPTLRTPMPMPLVAQPPARRGFNAALVVGLIAIAILAVGAAMLWPRTNGRGPLVAYNETTTRATGPQTTTGTQPAQKGTTQAAVLIPSGSVTSVTGENPLAAPPATTAAPLTAAPAELTAPVQSQPAPVPVPKAATRVERTAETPAIAPAAAKESDEESQRRVFSRRDVPTYTDGGDHEDDEINEKALEQLRNEIAGTKKLAIRAGGMQVELTRSIRDHLPEIEFVPYADVVIRFEGTLEPLGRGRKRRAATAVVLKNDRVVFRYEMPEEVFRVGAHPHEAFASVLSEGLQR